ncbi:SPOR domain-containing protein [Thioclava dalianensis]|uniref:SPOR domain-containing protein n=1 Tax=Thioclava dalianensis TaxID=1185766 RepID=UPI000571D926|nr:SPOR domain-containing protein [Thioclava dalianensis]
MRQLNLQGNSLRRKASVLALTLAGGLMLSACQDGAKPFDFLKKKPGDATADTSSSTSTNLVERDVEAPQVFSVDEKALWDGRPSLGGVWVAYPGVKDPERVIIRNPSNGKFVIGALFRREIDNPGPKLQVSSDAADALGMLAGAPAELSVVALRRETAPAEDETTPLVDKPVIAKPDSVDQTPLAPPKGAATTTEPAAKPAIGAPPTPAPAPAAPVNAAPESPSPKPAAKTAPSGRSFVQIGIFSSEANANRAKAQMAKAGVIATIKKEKSQSKTFWRVIAGPAPSKPDLEALKTTIHKLGYPDAYAVSN